MIDGNNHSVDRLLSGKLKRRVYGLRDYSPPGDCYVFKANPDGSKGELLRIEQPMSYDGDFKFGKGINI